MSLLFSALMYFLAQRISLLSYLWPQAVEQSVCWKAVLHHRREQCEGPCVYWERRAPARPALPRGRGDGACKYANSTCHSNVMLTPVVLTSRILASPLQPSPPSLQVHRPRSRGCGRLPLKVPAPVHVRAHRETAWTSRVLHFLTANNIHTSFSFEIT